MPSAGRAAADWPAGSGQDPPEVTWPDPGLEDGAVEELSPPESPECDEDEPDDEDERDECWAVEAWAEAGRV